jgi:hypothetical protein
LLEPASPFDDLFSLGIEPDLEWRCWRIDVVGAGFDASDLKRGDVTPHEQIVATLEAQGLVVTDRQIATAEVQRAAQEIRIAKVAHMLGSTDSDVGARLRARGETMLLDAPEYRPIPVEMLGHCIAEAARLRPALARHGLDDRRVSISLSYLGAEARLVFWDVVWPGFKYVVGDA